MYKRASSYDVMLHPVLVTISGLEPRDEELRKVGDDLVKLVVQRCLMPDTDGG